MDSKFNWALVVRLIIDGLSSPGCLLLMVSVVLVILGVLAYMSV